MHWGISLTEALRAAVCLEPAIKGEATQMKIINLDAIKTLIGEQLLAWPTEYFLLYLYVINPHSCFLSCIPYTRGVGAREVIHLYMATPIWLPCK